MGGFMVAMIGLKIQDYFLNLLTTFYLVHIRGVTAISVIN